MGRTQVAGRAVPMTPDREFHAFNVLLNEETKPAAYVRTGLPEVNPGATAIGNIA